MSHTDHRVEGQLAGALRVAGERDRPQQLNITGYRTLTDAEIAIINRIKAKAEEVRAEIEDLQLRDNIDERWLAIGRTELQQGFMAVIRAVARPETF